MKLQRLLVIKFFVNSPMGLLIVKTNDLKYVVNIPEADYLDNIYNDLFDIFPLLPHANEVAES